MKVAVLTGAGASYGAGRLAPKTPPLGRELYKELAGRYPRSWGNLSWEYAGLLRRDFESGMQLIWEKRPDLVQRFMIDMALYFSEFAPANDRSDCYSRLAKAIAEKRLLGKIASATLNYDCVMDIAASREGLKIAYAGFPPPEDNLTIWKLHGACNLMPKDAEVRNALIVGKSIFDGPVDAVDLRLVRKRYEDDGLAIPPVMCVYMPGKPTQTAPCFVTHVRREWANWMEEADEVVIIGVCPNLVERYVWEPILQSPAQVHYVGGQGGDYSELRSRLGGRFRHIAPTFDSALATILDDLDRLGNS